MNEQQAYFETELEILRGRIAYLENTRLKLIADEMEHPDTYRHSERYVVALRHEREMAAICERELEKWADCEIILTRFGRNIHDALRRRYNVNQHTTIVDIVTDKPFWNVEAFDPLHDRVIHFDNDPEDMFATVTTSILSIPLDRWHTERGDCYFGYWQAANTLYWSPRP